MASTLRSKVIAFTASCLLVAALIGIGETYCRLFTRINFLDNSSSLFAYDRFGTVYGNTPNFEGISFGQKFQTDADGFRIDPEVATHRGGDAILIMGDSVSFGPALADDVTIAGDLRRSMPGTTIYNGSVIGYDTFAYRAATSSIVAAHPDIKTVLLFFCLNDVGDASAQAIKARDPRASQQEPESPGMVRRVNDFLRSRSKLYLWLKNALVDTPMVYFRADLAAYRLGDDNFAASMRPLLDLSRELRDKHIGLKVFVLPYEAQLRSTSTDGDRQPQQMVMTYLKANDVEGYDLTADFEARKPQTNLLFLYGDPMHLSADGSKVVADSVCSKVADCGK